MAPVLCPQGQGYQADKVMEQGSRDAVGKTSGHRLRVVRALARKEGPSSSSLLHIADISTGVRGGSLPLVLTVPPTHVLTRL